MKKAELLSSVSAPASQWFLSDKDVKLIVTNQRPDILTPEVPALVTYYCVYNFRGKLIGLFDDPENIKEFCAERNLKLRTVH